MSQCECEHHGGWAWRECEHHCGCGPARDGEIIVGVRDMMGRMSCQAQRLCITRGVQLVQLLAGRGVTCDSKFNIT